MRTKGRNILLRQTRTLLVLCATFVMIGPLFQNITFLVQAGQYEVGSGWLSDESLEHTYNARRLARAYNGDLYVAYSVTVDGYEQIYLGKSIDNGVSWITGEFVNRENTTQKTPCLLIDSQDHIIVLWKDDTNTLFFKQKVNTIWEPVETVASDVGSGFVAAAISPDDSVHVLYSSDISGCRYRMRNTSGWQAEEVVSGGSYQRARDILINENGDIHTFYHDAGTQYFILKHKVKSAGVWSDETNIDQPNNQAGGPSAIIDEQGILHVVWCYKTGSSYSICHRQYNTSWDPVAEIVIGPTDYIQSEPSLSVDAQNTLHLIWYGTHEGSPTTLQVRYSKYVSSWGNITNLTAAEVDQRNVISLWGNYPIVEGEKINRPRTGYAFAWNDNATVRFFKSDDLTWENAAPDTPSLTGTIKGKIKTVYEYQLNTTDKEGNDIWYRIDWGDNTSSDWVGPYASGLQVTVDHQWTKKGTYIIKAQAKDMYGNESDWATLSVKMPYTMIIPFGSFWEQLFERFPHAFPLLRHVLGY